MPTVNFSTVLLRSLKKKDGKFYDGKHPLSEKLSLKFIYCKNKE